MIQVRVPSKASLATFIVLTAWITGCGSATRSDPQVSSGTAASCAALNSSEQYAHATLVVLATALAGRTVQLGSQYLLASPARMRIGRYIKGHGPRILEVETAVTAHGARRTVTEDGIAPVAGQRWRLFLTGEHSPYQTSICVGSRPVSANQP